jgi:hypothetical protein
MKPRKRSPQKIKRVVKPAGKGSALNSKATERKPSASAASIPWFTKASSEGTCPAGTVEDTETMLDEHGNWVTVRVCRKV